MDHKNPVNSKIGSKNKRKSSRGNKRKNRKPSKYKKKNQIIKGLAAERIEFLMENAIKIYSENSELGEIYKDMARSYSKSCKTPIPRNYKQFICHKCKKLMIPGISSRVRIHSEKKRGSRLIKTCLHCDNIVHIYFKVKK